MGTILFGPFPPPNGGVATYLESLQAGLLGRGVTCAVKNAGPGPAGVSTTFLSILVSFRSLQSDDTCLDSSTFFVEYPSARALAAWQLSRVRRRFRWVKVLHDGSLPARFPRLPLRSRITARTALACADHVVAVSEPLRQWATEVLRVPASRLSVVGSLLPIPEGAECRLPEEIDSLFAPPGRRVISAIGTFSKNYGFDQIAAAVDQLRSSSGEDLQLLLLDPGFCADDRDLSAAVLAGRDWITVAKALPRGAVLRALRRSAALVRGTQHESVGLSRIEGLLCGIPVVATRAGETRGMRLYDFGDVAALERQLCSALSLGPAADAARWVETFTAEARRNLDLLEVLLTEQAVAAR